MAVRRVHASASKSMAGTRTNEFLQEWDWIGIEEGKKVETVVSGRKPPDIYFQSQRQTSSQHEH